MTGLVIVGGMVIAALVPLGLMIRLVRRGHAGWSMTLLSVLGACLMVLLYAAGRPFGVDPVLAMSLALLVVLPAVLGGGAGALLGWLLRKRDDRRIKEY